MQIVRGRNLPQLLYISLLPQIFHIANKAFLYGNDREQSSPVVCVVALPLLYFSVLPYGRTALLNMGV